MASSPHLSPSRCGALTAHKIQQQNENELLKFQQQRESELLKIQQERECNQARSAKEDLDLSNQPLKLVGLGWLCVCVPRTAAQRERERERERKRAKRIGGKSPATREGEPVVVVVEEKRVVDEEEKRVFVSRTGKKSLFIYIYLCIFCVRRDQKSHGLSSRIAARAAIRGGPGERQRIQQQGRCGRECERCSDGRRRKQYE